MSREIEQLLRSLVSTLARVPTLPDAPVRITLRVLGNTAAVRVTPNAVGSGTILFDAPLPSVPASPCVLSICVGQATCVHLPVRLAAEGTAFRASVNGAALVLRRRPARNVRLEEALGLAA